MKLRSAGIRIFRGMKKRLTAVFLMSLFCVGVTAADDRIEKVGPSNYESGVITLNFSGVRYDNLSFTGSSYLSGKLSIVSSDKSATTVTCRKMMKAESIKQAEEFADYIEVYGEQLENELSISAETKSVPPWNSSDWSGQVEIEIAVPRNENLKIDVRTSAFSVDVKGPFTAIDVSSSLSDVSLEKITGKTRVSIERGSVNVRDCSGPVSVSTSLQPITLSRVDGKLGSIKLRNSNARIILEYVRGEIDARTSNAAITASRISFEAGHSQLATENSSIDVDADAVNGDLTIRNVNSKINLALPANTSADYLLQVDQPGRIYTRDLPMTVSLASQTRVVGSHGNQRSKIEVDMSGAGTVTLEGKPANRTSLR